VERGIRECMQEKPPPGHGIGKGFYRQKWASRKRAPFLAEKKKAARIRGKKNSAIAKRSQPSEKEALQAGKSQDETTDTKKRIREWAKIAEYKERRTAKGFCTEKERLNHRTGAGGCRSKQKCPGGGE